jgi:hypothetical protein
MPRRNKNQKKSIFLKEINLKQVGFFGSKNNRKGDNNFRFGVSLIILTAVLEMSLYIFLLTLVNGQKMKNNDSFPLVATASTKKEQSSRANQELSDASLDFKLTIPSQLGDWKYRIGYVKSPIDENLSNQYLRIYLPEGKVKNSRNFEEANKDFLTIRKFDSEEWSKLEKGCEKDNLIFCEAMGEKIAEKNGLVYAYTKTDGCSSNKPDSKCNLIDKIIGSFRPK